MTQQPNEYKEVYFDQYCDKCKHKDLPEESEVCNSCLTYAANLYSHKPINFEEVGK